MLELAAKAEQPPFERMVGYTVKRDGALPKSTHGGYSAVHMADPELVKAHCRPHYLIQRVYMPYQNIRRIVLYDTFQKRSGDFEKAVYS